MKLSLCMIVKNEEATLRDCLHSVKDVVDEMVVLDTGSTDRTVEIAQELGANVYFFEWCNDFAVARNEALRFVTGDWVIVLDADEKLKPEIVPLMRQAMQNEQCILINLIRHEVGAAQSPYSMVSRLFRHHPELYFTHPYHAMVDDSVAELLEKQPNWQILELAEVAISHEGYTEQAIGAQNKFNRAASAMEAYLSQYPNDPYTCSKLGALYVRSGKIERGIQLLEIGLRGVPSWRTRKPVEVPVLYELHYHLGIAYSRIGKASQAKSHYLAAMEMPVLPYIKLGTYNNYGNLLLETGDITGAIIAYTTVLELDPTLATAHFNLGIAYKDKGQLQDAIKCYRQAIALNPNFAEAYQNLGVALLKAGNVFESLDTFREAITRYEEQQSPAAAKLRQSLKEMGLRI
ncbi:tetratricopeptide repeat protein [Ancylothrix sp. C2]|uniref:tetratricopeptide repeat protein n=1 Tax=Ancylothrix sp. D3o TaxID=2953691 RepID=UPI0021BA9409|nr:tetratricopeptide repeat protein [Ancylothrix sp. D3o]MCT7951711.1 tetratricopeptide repeat protein [Ancylothrix sp. D3o]